MRWLPTFWDCFKGCDGDSRKSAQEFVIEVTGQVVAREQANDKLGNRCRELLCAKPGGSKYQAKQLPFLRLRTALKPMTIHVCSLPRPSSSSRDVETKLRAKVTHSIRNYLDELEFIDVETFFLSSQRQKERVTIWCHLVSIISTLFLKALKSLSNSWWMLVLTVTIKSSNVSVTTYVGDRQPEFTQVDLEIIPNRARNPRHHRGLIARVDERNKGISKVTLPFPVWSMMMPWFLRFWQTWYPFWHVTSGLDRSG